MIGLWILMHLHFDWYPAMGVHAVHVVAFHHWISIGFVQDKPRHVVFRMFCDYLG